MRIVISGGTGLIGQALVKSLVSDNHEVVILSRNPKKHRASQPAGASLVAWDAKSVGPWASAVDGAGAVINLAGESLAGDGFLPGRWTKEKKRRIRESRVNAGQALVKAIEMAEKKPRILLQASAVGFYGSRGSEIVTESTGPGDDFLAQVGVEWEASTRPVEELGVQWVAARIGLVLSPEGGALPRLLLPFTLFAGGYFGDGRQWWPWVHLDDAVRGIRFLVESESLSGPVNVTSPGSLTNRAFSNLLGRVLRRPAFLPIPGFVLRTVLGEVATTVLDGQRAIPQRLNAIGFSFRFPELEYALRHLLDRPAPGPLARPATSPGAAG